VPAERSGRAAVFASVVVHGGLGLVLFALAGQGVEVGSNLVPIAAIDYDAGGGGGGAGGAVAARSAPEGRALAAAAALTTVDERLHTRLRAAALGAALETGLSEFGATGRATGRAPRPPATVAGGAVAIPPPAPADEAAPLGAAAPSRAPAPAALPAALEEAALAALFASPGGGPLDLDGTGAPGLDAGGDGGPGARHVALAATPTPDPAEVARAERAARVYDEYGAYLRARIGPLWEFPKERALLGEEGTVRVAFVIHRDGRVSDIRVTRHSGFADFDANVVAAVRKAGPFKPLPAEIARDELRFDVPFDFDNPVVLYR
jgi:protein TonB